LPAANVAVLLTDLVGSTASASSLAPVTAYDAGGSSICWTILQPTEEGTVVPEPLAIANLARL
jgi:hypothetical protein